MSRVCTVCQHPSRAQIDSAAIAGASYRDITRQFGVSKDAVCRHKADHLLAELVKAHEAKELADADTLMAEAQAYKGRLVAILDATEAEHDYRSAISAANGIRGYIELMAKLVGLIDSRPQINILMAPEWLAVRTAMLQALSPYADARVAVASALLRLEAQQNGHTV